MSSQVKTQAKPKAKNYEFSEVEVTRWEMVGVVNGKQQFEFDVIPKIKSHLGMFSGTTKVGDSFVAAIKAHPDVLYDVVLRVTPSGVCTLIDGRSFKRD